MKITIRGADKVIASFQASPKVLEGAVSEAIETSAKLIKQRARRKAGSPPIVNTGELARGIDYRMTGRLSARVGADATYSPFVEYGRKPGRMPPVAPIERWAETKLGASGLGFIIARKIARRGTRAQPFFFPSVDDSIAEIGRIFSTAVDKFMKKL